MKTRKYKQLKMGKSSCLQCANYITFMLQKSISVVDNYTKFALLFSANVRDWHLIRFPDWL